MVFDNICATWFITIKLEEILKKSSTFVTWSVSRVFSSPDLGFLFRIKLSGVCNKLVGSNVLLSLESNVLLSFGSSFQTVLRL